MKNTNQNWKGLTKDMFNPQLFGETLFGSGHDSSEIINDDCSDLIIDEMGYDAFVEFENERKKKKVSQRRTPASFN